MWLVKTNLMALSIILGCRLAFGGDTHMPVQVAQDGTSVSYSLLGCF